MKGDLNAPYRDGYLHALHAYCGAADLPLKLTCKSDRIAAYLFELDGRMRVLKTDDIAHLEYELSLAPSRPELLLMLEAIATSRLANEGPFDDYLDQVTLQALALAPSLPTVKGTRGAALACFGRHEEALALLAQADESNDFNRALNAAFRALAHFHAQRPDEAHANMGIAVDLLRSQMHVSETGTCIIERICQKIGFQMPGADILG